MTDWLCVRVCVCLRVVGRFWRRRRNGLWVHKCVYVAGCYVVNRSARYSNPLDVCVRLPITKQEELTDLHKEGNCSYTATIWQTSNRTGQGVYSWKLINCWRTAVFMSCPVGAYNCTHTFLTTNAQNVGLWLLCFWLLFCLGTWSTLQNSLQINIFTRAAKFSANKYYVAFMCHQNHSKYEFAGGKIGHERCIFKLYSTGKLIKFW